MYRIAEARKKKGWNQQQLAEAVGTTQQVISRYESGEREPKTSTLVKICEVTGVSFAYILGMDSSEIRAAKSSPSHMIPLKGRIAAGEAREAIENADEYHPLPDYLYEGNEESFWLRVSGNSMNRYFPDGTLVLVNPKKEVQNGDIGVVFVNGDDATIKRVYYEDGDVRLHPESYDQEYRDIVIRRGDPRAPIFRVVGKVVSYTAPMDWRP